ncbi:MAG: lipocalin family protein [Chitinophagaceae bacterium]|nr:lipocalin family protein [Chitinophagaceae bacterium]
MRKSTIKYLLLATLALPILSCQKEGDPPKTRTELLASGAWKLQSATANGSDVTSQVPTCNKDNETTFQSNGTGNLLEKANVCSPSNETNFTWSFQNNETELALSAQLIPSGSGNFTIVTLTETTLVLSQASTLIPGPPITIVGTFVHP